MAMLCASSSVVFSSSSSTSSSTPNLSFPSLKTLNKASSSSASLFLGFPVGRLNASVKTTLPVNTKWAFQFRCQDLSIVRSLKSMDHVVDATDKTLGRLASTIAIHIRGKNLATYTPSVDMGAYVIVVTAEKVVVSVKKRTQKLYRRHSGRPGGMKVETFDQLQQRIPERIIEHAVCGMLPNGDLVEHCSPI